MENTIRLEFLPNTREIFQGCTHLLNAGLIDLHQQLKDHHRRQGREAEIGKTHFPA